MPRSDGPPGSAPPPAAREAAGPRAAEPQCPVCLSPAPDCGPDTVGEVRCRRCQWVLCTGYRLGPVTPDREQAFQDQLRSAIRDLDAITAVTAAGYPDAGDAALLGQLAILAREGPLTPAELDAARATAAQAHGTRRLATARDAAERAAAISPGAADVVVVELDEDGMLARTYTSGGHLEDARLLTWSWSELFPDLPASAVTRRFWLAGGVGERLPPHSAVPPAARRWADCHASQWPVTAALVHQERWPVLDAFAAVLADRGPVLLSGRAASATPRRPAALRLPAARGASDPAEYAITASAIVETGIPPAGAGPAGAAPESVGESPARAIVAATGRGGQVFVWRIPGTAGPQPLTLLPAAATCIALAPGGTAVAAGTRDGDVRWHLVAGSASARLLAHGGRVTAVRFGPGVVVSTGADGWLHCVPVGGGGPDVAAKVSFDVGVSGCSALAACPKEPVALVGGLDGVLRLIDLAGKSCTELPGIGQTVTALDLDAAGRLAAVGLADGAVRLLDLKSGAWRAVFPAGNGVAGPVSVRAAGPRSVVLAAASPSGRIRYWSGFLNGDEEAVSDVGFHEGGVRGLALLSTGDLVSVGRADGMLRLWSPPVRATMPGSAS